jgi:polysaccharide deacetylase family protein (PEP-CTERM system associated)
VSGTQPPEKARVLHIITRTFTGGATMNTLLSCRDLSGRGFPSAILAGSETGSEGDYEDLIEEWGIPVIRSTHLRRAISPLHDLLAFFEMRRIIREGGYDIVHTHTAKPYFIGRLSAKLPFSARVVQTVHGWFFYDDMNPLKRAIYVVLSRFGHRLANRSILVTYRDLAKAIRYDIGKSSDFAVIRSGVELANYREYRGQHAEARSLLGLAPDGERVVGSVMRLSVQKAPDIFLQVASRICQERDDVRFVLVGGGPLEKEVREQISELGLEDSVLLLGPREDVPRILPAFDVFLLTSRYEGLPRAILESLSAGVPVVSTAVDGVTEVVVDGEQGGFVCGFEDAESLADRAMRLLAEPALTPRLLQDIDEKLQPFEADGMIDDLEELYCDLVRDGLRVVLLCDSEPFNIPNAVLSIINRAPRHTYTIVQMSGHGSFRHLATNLRRYWSLYGIRYFFFRLASFLFRRLRGRVRLRVGRPCSLSQVSYSTGAELLHLRDINSAESLEKLRSLLPDVFISIACPEILRKDCLSIPRVGAYNVHSALLPENRGMMPVFWSLFGDSGRSGVTVHRMARKVDAGEILLQRTLRASRLDVSLEEQLRRSKECAADLVVESLEKLQSDPSPEHSPNDDSLATVNTFPTRAEVREFRRKGGRIAGLGGRPRIALTLDVEEWFQTDAASKWFPVERWEGLENRAPDTISGILDLLDESGTKITFFFLGWLAERFPELVVEVHERGHEVAYHNYYHEELTRTSRDEFSRGLDRFAEFLDRLNLPQPRGFRAPSFSLVRESMWAADELLSHSYCYDSSIYPMFRHRYGVPHSPTIPFALETAKGSLIEFPVASVDIQGTKIPVGGGAYMRFYPGLLFRHLLKRYQLRTGAVPVLYCHPWELDDARPGSGEMSPTQRFRQYHHAGSTSARRISKLFRKYRTITLAKLHDELLEDAESGVPLPRVFATSL